MWSNSGWQSDGGGWSKVGAAYVGPGDVTSFVTFGSVGRAYTAAYASGLGNAVDLVDQAGANAVTIKFLATGLIDVASINTWVTAHTVTTIKIAKLYDQVGSAHFVQATLANMPVMTLGALNSLPTMTFVSANSTILVATSLTQAQPLALVVVGKQTVAQNGDFFSSNSGLEFAGKGGLPNNIQMYDLTAAMNTTASLSAFHVMQGVFNGASSTCNVDGAAQNSGTNVGTGGLSGTMGVGGYPALIQFLDGAITEVGVISGTYSAGVQSNTRTAYGL